MRPTQDRELQEEIAHHLELEAARHVAAGVDAHTARQRALARFGDPSAIAEATRRERQSDRFDGIGQDVQWALRTLRRNAGFTALTVGTLTLGIGATITAFTVLDTVLLRPLPYRQPDQLVLIREESKDHATMPPSYPNFADWRARAKSFSGVASAMFPFSVTTWPSLTATEPLRVPMMGVSRHFFATLGVTPFLGREFTDDENVVGGAGDVIMVSYEFWRTQLGGRTPLGSIRVGDDAAKVIGVLPPGFRFISQADLFYPHERGPGTIRSAHNYLVIGRLAAGTSIERARAEMTSLSQAMARTFGNDTQAVDAEVTPLREFVVGSYRAMLTVVFAASALVLLIACTNLVSAQLARGWSREREIAVRSALGASRGRIARQLSIESVVLVVCGTGMALVFALAMTRALKAFGASLIPRLNEMSFDFRVVAFVIGAAIATVLLVGLYPATRLSRAAADAALRSSRGAATAIRASLWRLLVGFEVALAVVLLVGSALLVRTLHNILTSNSGIDVRGVITAAMMPRGEDAGRLDELSQSLGRVPGVEGVAFTNQLPFAWGSIAAPVRRPSDPVDHDWPAFAGFRLVSPDYFSVLRQPVLRGRSFTRADASGAEPVAIVTPGIAKKLWPGENPIGKKVATNYLDGSETVVGVVAEASSWSMPRGSQNEIFAPIAQHASALQGQLVAVLRTAKDPALVTTLVHAEIRRLLPRSPARMGTIEERVARSADDRRFAMLAITAFGATALLLAAAGIYGVVWYVVTTRTREIGIRLALGATAGRVQREFLGGALGVAAAGAGVGLVASAAASRYLSASLYGVSHLDPAAYLAGATVAMVAALAGAFVPAWRSSHVDPAVPLRMEG